MLSAVPKRSLFVSFLNLTNRKKLLGAKSGLYCSWGTTAILFLERYCISNNAVWALALSWWCIQPYWKNPSGIPPRTPHRTLYGTSYGNPYRFPWDFRTGNPCRFPHRCLDRHPYRNLYGGWRDNIGSFIRICIGTHRFPLRKSHGNLYEFLHGLLCRLINCFLCAWVYKLFQVPI